MLVLTRKIQESVVAGGAPGFERLLRVTVLDISGGRVRLGFEADADLPVYRSELWEEMIAKRGPPEDPPAPAEERQGTQESKTSETKQE
jgi:carbon storage regulator CsrA